VLLAVVVLGGCGGASKPAAPPPAPRPSDLQAPRLDPYRASLAYARCMRAHGVAHPNPDAQGDFHLTPAQERKMRASATPAQHEAADRACFDHLKGTVSTQPLSKAAQRAALAPLRELKACLHGFGIEVGKPIVKTMTRGRAMFGFDSAGPRASTQAERARRQKAQRACEKRVHLAQRIDEIVKLDRGEDR